MSANAYKAKDISVKSFEDTSRSAVEYDFEQWKQDNPECWVLDICYRAYMSPVYDSSDGRIFTLYTITIAYANEP
jgi:hypothetical protein